MRTVDAAATEEPAQCRRPGARPPPGGGDLVRSQARRPPRVRCPAPAHPGTPGGARAEGAGPRGSSEEAGGVNGVSPRKRNRVETVCETGLLDRKTPTPNSGRAPSWSPRGGRAQAQAAAYGARRRPNHLCPRGLCGAGVARCVRHLPRRQSRLEPPFISITQGRLKGVFVGTLWAEKRREREPSS